MANRSANIRQRPPLLVTYLDRVAKGLLTPETGPLFDFSLPIGMPALTDPQSVSWRIFRNPLSLFAGGVAGVVMELGEPRVRTGVWDHSSFRTDPLMRMKRTALAAMATVYGAQDPARLMIGYISARHGEVKGVTPAGVPYAANDQALLDWVQATASFGFLEAYNAYVTPLSNTQCDRFLSEALPAASLFGAVGAPRTLTERDSYFLAMQPLLEPSPIIFDFLAIMQKTPIFPWPLRWLQTLLVRAGVSLVPSAIRERLGLGDDWTVSRFDLGIIGLLARAGESVNLPSSPPVQACRRLGLNENLVFSAPLADGLEDRQQTI